MRSAAHITRPVPPLQNGDHLTVQEFERRYEAMPHLKKAELIHGVVHIPSPVRVDSHGKQHGATMTWLGHYWAYTPGTELADNSTLKLAIGQNQPQPDAALRILPDFGGKSKTVDGYIVGAAELIAEISASSLAYDLHEKLLAFEENGVQEYVVWRVEDEALDWFQLKAGKFQPLGKAKGGLYKSKVFPGLWLDPKALIGSDLVTVLEVAQAGIASPEHQRFVKKLAAHKTK